MSVDRLTPRETAFTAAIADGRTPLEAMQAAGYRNPTETTATALAAALAQRAAQAAARARQAAEAFKARTAARRTARALMAQDRIEQTRTVEGAGAEQEQPSPAASEPERARDPTDPATLPAPTSATDGELVAQVEADLRRRDIEPKVRLDLTRWLLDYRRALITRDTAESYPDPALVAAFLVRRSQPDAQPVPEAYAREVITQVAALLGVTLDASQA